MLSHVIPERAQGVASSLAVFCESAAVARIGAEPRRTRRSADERAVGTAPPARAGEGDERVRLDLYQPARRERARVDTRTVSGGAGGRRVRRPVLYPDPRHEGLRCGRQCAPRAYRRDARRLSALLGGARISLDDAHRRQRDPARRSGRTGDPYRHHPSADRDHRARHLRRSSFQVSDLGAGPLRGVLGGGQFPVARLAEGARLRPPRSGHSRGEAGMSAGHGGDAVGGPARHVPVLLAEVMHYLAPAAGGVFIDGTFGAGGYSRAILSTGASVIAIDRDPTAIARGGSLAAEAGDRLTLVEGRFS